MPEKVENSSLEGIVREVVYHGRMGNAVFHGTHGRVR